MEKNQIVAMLDLQNRMNSKVNPEWVTQGWNFLRAARQELHEGIDHYGWKWWKKQEPNIEQAKIELVDVWHFIMSDVIVQAQGDLGVAADIAYNAQQKPGYSQEPLWAFENLINATFITHPVTRNPAVFGWFFDACRSLDLSEEELYTVYVGKNVLNIFRQDNGYKDGTYIKIWNGEEDNVHLEEILRETKDPAEILNRLQSRYFLVCAPH